MNSKHHYNTQKLTLTKPNKKSLFGSDDGESTTPHSTNSTKHKQEFQTDDSDCGTPNTPSNKSPSKPQQSKFKPKPTTIQQLFTSTARNVLSNKQAHSDAESKPQKQHEVSIKNHTFRHLIFGESVSETSFQKHLLLTQRGLIYATKCLKGPSDQFIKLRQVEVPKEENKSKILLLDLDETLIHSCNSKEQAQVNINQISFNVRPYTNYFINKLSQIYSIFIFTASSSSYASAIVDYLDPDQTKIIGIFSRNHCMETKNGFFIKDLRTLKDIDLSSTLIVDNLAHSFGLQIDNGIPILEWKSDEKDQELKYLTEYLIKASQVEDVRQFNRENLRLRELINYQL
ncbi:unnamed protein product (macronuclear) [Paramecium tetraurelia]|uniref:Mitochondrial import inner membrane translocase subunit TIM50 n=1 Tax=Paramecium tetraurelia TaxID=5888 RepID=A0BZD2_PARTE|nr:uncharacterized protein GSPATT00033752001 [Paramecium tetraurelia]CAK63899.1 unnamed protein product [Paramecium tetraurelia]|eukprot:XP_001431297.1 hypothetical protein (macronuclear) [Paramecium tetraurelia strain d4-2]